jgi:hypothetical protein
MSRNDQLFLGTIWNDKKEPKCCNITPTPSYDNWVSVTDYGAVGDGITDNTLNIQAALDSDANVILIPSGTYAITGTLTVPSFKTIFGYGATLLRIANTTAMMLNQADGVTGGYNANEHITILGLSFNGNGAIYPTSATLLAIGHAKNILLRDCEFYNIPGYHGVEINGVTNTTVDRCTFHDMLNGSEFLQLDVMNGPGLFPWFGPFDNTLCDGVVVTNCLFYDGAAGVGSHSGSNLLQHKDVVWSKNTFRNLTGAAMAPFTYINITITDNLVDSCAFGVAGGRFGMTLTRNMIITGNSFVNITAGGGGNWGRAIELQSIDDIVISNNVINKSFGSAITLHNCDRFSVTDNKVVDYGGYTVTDTYGVHLDNSNYGVVANNTLLRDVAGFASNTNIVINNGGGTNVTVENNIMTTITPTTVFNTFSGNSVLVGTNTINGTITPYISTKTADYTYAPTDRVLNVDTSASNVIITIDPRIFNKAGLTVRKTTGDANTVTIAASSGTINGAASITLTTQNQTALIASDWVNLDATIK